MPERPDRPPERSYGPAEGLRRAQRPHEHPLVNVNRAGYAALVAVRDLGETRAAAIIAHRNRHGPFRSLEELSALPHFDAEVMNRLRDRLTV